MFGTLRNIFRHLVPPSIEGDWGQKGVTGCYSDPTKGSKSLTCDGGKDGGGSARLSIEGIAPAPLTPEPDDAELAAAALLEAMTAGKNERMKKTKNEKAAAKGSREYYQALSEKIKAAHEQERRAAMRFVAFAESELAPIEISKSRDVEMSKKERRHDLAALEQGLFKWQDVVEREGGELLRRWQHCLADITIRQMSEVKSEKLKVKNEAPEEEEKKGAEITNPPNH